MKAGPIESDINRAAIISIDFRCHITQANNKAETLTDISDKHCLCIIICTPTRRHHSLDKYYLLS